MTADAEAVAHDRLSLLFAVRRSRRYHLHRQQFFARLNFLAGFLAALAGSATMASVLLASEWAAWLAAGTAIVGAIELAGQTTTRAGLHGDLAREFTVLERDMELGGEDIDQQELRTFRARRLDIEMKEPPPYYVLNVICHNEEVLAGGYPRDHVVPVRWWQRVFASLVDLRPHLLEKSAPTS